MNFVMLTTAEPDSMLGTILGHMIIVTGAFVLLLVLIRIFAWQKIKAIFEERAKHISDEIDAAETVKKEAHALLLERHEKLDNVRKEADAILQEAKQTGEAMKERMRLEAEKEAALIKEKAEKDVARMRAEALAEMKDEVSNLSVNLAQDILAKELDDEGHRQLIDRYLDKLGE